MALAKMTGEIMKIPWKAVCKMIENNEHNKYITVYYLLEKKLDRGELDLSQYTEKTVKNVSSEHVSVLQKKKDAVKGVDVFKRYQSQGKKAQKSLEISISAGNSKTPGSRSGYHSRDPNRSHGQQKILMSQTTKHGRPVRDYDLQGQNPKNQFQVKLESKEISLK